MQRVRQQQSRNIPNRRYRRGEVTLRDFLMLLFVLLGGLNLAVYAGEQYGWVAGLLGLVIGPLVCLALLYLLLAALALLLAALNFLAGFLWNGVPYLPNCGNGTCKSGMLTDFGDYVCELDESDRTRFRCRCGLLYERESGRVLEVLPDGTTKPYMVWKPFRGWRPDRQNLDTNS